jgi:hypothetical protein
LLPYWLLFSFFTAGALEYRRRGNAAQQAAPLLIAGGLLIAAMIGFRYQVGGDWANYLTIFDWVGGISATEALNFGDPAYTFINWIAQKIGVDIWFVNFVCGLIFSWGLIRFARQQSNPWLAVVVAIPYLVIVVAMGYSRQGVAIGIILAGLAKLERTSIARFTLYIFFAAAFHKSAIVVLPLVGMSVVRNRLLVAGMLAVFAVMLYYFFVQASFDRMITNYIEAEYNSQGAAIRVVMNIPPALIYLAFWKRFNLPPQQHKLWRNFSIAALGALVLLFYLESSTAVDRLALYIIPLQMVVFSRLPEAFGVQGRPNGQYAAFVIAYSGLIQFVWLTYAAHAGDWLPFQLWPMDQL